MQSLSVPQGDHNPEGHTRSEVLRALQGLDGTRQLSFRYELLDSDNRKVRALDNVISGSVSQNWLAEIKRTAKFELRDDGTINYLSQRIKPWVRLHLPGRWIAAETTPAPADPANQIRVNTFNGDHDTAITTTNSGNHGDAFDNVDSTGVVYDNDSLHGSGCMRLDDPDASNGVSWTGLGLGDCALRVYIKRSSETQAGNVWWNDVTGAAYLDSVGSLTTAGLSLPGALPGDTWCRVEFTRSGSTADLKVWSSDPESTGDPDDNTTGEVATGSISQWWLEHQGEAVRFDSWALGDTAEELGPFPQETVTPAHIDPEGFVEWPQGVFLLSTPSRSVDGDDVVTRDVEGYDQLQVYADDKVPDRYTAGQLHERFESTNLAVTAVSGDWVRTTAQARDGVASYRSAEITHGQTSDFTVEVPQGATTVTFHYRVSSEDGFDFFRFLIDGVHDFEASGEVAWTRTNADVSEASTITFRYAKDGSVSEGEDAAWIDSLIFDVPARYTDEISSLLGAVQQNLTPSDRVIPTPKEWDPGTSKLEIINDLLAAINYESLSFDEDGRAVVRPYVTPQDRAEEYVYADDEVSVMVPEATQDLDLFDIPNRWILTVSDADRDAIRAMFTNRDPASPTSTVRRGRTITEFVTETDASDRSTLVEKAIRLAFEASKVFESVEFETALMPIHSGNDAYRIRRDPLAVDAKYVEHTWEMPLEAGAAMKHSARRVVTLTASMDSSIRAGDFVVTGAVDPANMSWGAVTITPVADTPTSTTVTGLALEGTGPVRAQANSHTTVPGSTVKECGVSGLSPDGLKIWIYRTNTTDTHVHYLIMRDA